MYWQISKLVMTMWKNRFRQILRRAPYLWLVLGLVPLCYVGGAYLAYDFVFKSLQPLAANTYQTLYLKPIIISAFFCSFGLTAFVLMIAALLFSPDETSLKRIFTPLPLSASQQRFGVLFPGIIFLFIAQNLLWVPTLLALMQLGFAQLLPLILATLCGLLCYNALTLAFHQGILYGTALVFGTERVNIRTTATGLSISAGMVLLMIPLILGGQALSTGQLGWMVFVPSYWMVLGLSSSPTLMLAGLGLLLATGLVCLVLYIFFIERCERLALGTKGHWVPLRRFSFPRSFFLSSCVYELKAMSRDQQLVVGLVMVIGGWLAAAIALLWIGKSNLLLKQGLVEITVDLITVLLCAIAHMSWGRDRQTYRVLASAPLDMRRFLNGKLCTNFLVIVTCWLLLVGTIAWIGGEMASMPNQLPLLCLGSIFCFWLGIAVPYSANDSLSMLLVMGIMTVLGLPFYMLFQLAQSTLAQLPGGDSTRLLVQFSATLALLAALYIAIHQLNRLRMEKDRD